MSSRLSSRAREQEGSLPLALLATIVVAGLIAVVISRVVAGEGATRFDRDFTEALPIADIGINRGLFALNEGLTPPSTPTAVEVDGIEYAWSATQNPTSPREWEVVSESTTPSGVSRRLVATVEEEPLFFPGAFGDTFVGLNGASSHVDSYNSGDCTTPAPACRWGTDPRFGTGNGSIGTNDVLDLRGNIDVRPGGALLYDWDDNPGEGTSTEFGDRCVGQTRCTSQYVSTVGRKIDMTSTARTGFVVDKFATGGKCADTSSPRYTWRTTRPPSGDWKIGENRQGQNPPVVLRSAADEHGFSKAVSNPADPAFDNFYCAESLQFLWNVRLDASVSAANPVVIFVKDLVSIDGQRSIACHGDGATPPPCDPGVSDATQRQVRPVALRLQIYVAASPDVGNNVTVRQGSKFAGVVYAPFSGCGGPANGNSDIYGMMLCSRMDNVGNWKFHYDDALGNAGTGLFNVAFWREEAPTP